MSLLFLLSFVSGMLLAPLFVGIAVFYFLDDAGVKLDLLRQII